MFKLKLMKAIISALLLCIVFISCKKNEQVEAHVYADTLLRNFMIEQFELQKRWPKVYIDELIAEQHENRNEITLRPGGIKLQYFNIPEDFRYSAFAVKITNVEDSTLAYFTFTDEIHYMQHDVSAMFDSASTIKILRRGNTHPGHANDINLEKNLNNLIQTLRLQHNRYQIDNLLYNLFVHTLHMREAKETYLNIVIDYLKDFHSKDSLLVKAMIEYNKLKKDFNKSECLIVMPREGSHAFWKLTVEGDTSNYRVRANLIGKLFFYQIRL